MAKNLRKPKTGVKNPAAAALLLCGLGCGAFYAVCLLAATLLANGRLDWQGSNAMLPLALLLGGLLGGALTALRAGR